MPILDVEVVLEEGELLPSGAAASLADAAAAVFGSAPGRTWVRLSSVPQAEYAEDGGGPPEGVAPVFVSVVKRRLGGQQELRREAESLTAAIAEVLGRPAENIHILYEAPGLGRIAFGGRLMLE